MIKNFQVSSDDKSLYYQPFYIILGEKKITEVLKH